jgi:hypothetical protein
MVSVVVHSNPGLKNQIESAGWLRAGFIRHGLDVDVTADRSKRGDVNVIQGPWWAYQQLLGTDNTLFLDRCFYGHPRWDVSIGWLNADGSRDFRNECMGQPKGELPELKPRKTRQRHAIVFGDYARDARADVLAAREKHACVYFRPHPQEPHRHAGALRMVGTLEGVWALCDAAYGHSSTVLVDAVINGLHVESSDPRHVVNGSGNRDKWLARLSWANWSHAEIIDGSFWEHLGASR